MTIGIDAVLLIEPGPGEVEFDISFGPDGDIVTEDSFEAAILVSLFTDRRASAEEAPVARQRRGWVGDLETPEDPIGSLLWLLDQSRVTATTAARAADYAERALGWLVSDGIAVAVSADAQVEATRVLLDVTLTRPNARSDRRWVVLWDKTGRP
jgi:phage gp46-like protein